MFPRHHAKYSEGNVCPPAGMRHRRHVARGRFRLIGRSTPPRIAAAARLGAGCVEENKGKNRADTTTDASNGAYSTKVRLHVENYQRVMMLEKTQEAQRLFERRQSPCPPLNAKSGQPGTPTADDLKPNGNVLEVA